MSVRHEGRAVRRWTQSRSGTTSIALGVALGFVLQLGCDGWPPGNRNDPNTTSSTTNTNGTCSGAPLPCSALVGAQCSSNAGCVDNGSCIGTSTTTGLTCNTPSPTDCSGVPGCYWSGACTGTPYGNCSAVTQAACLLAQGCVWTPTPTAVLGTAGTTGTPGVCQTFHATCVTAVECDCGLTCVKQCPSCTAVCGAACLSNDQCAGTTGGGLSTPYCKFVLASTAAPPYSGLCSNTP
jgi:hypothetical protein